MFFILSSLECSIPLQWNILMLCTLQLRSFLPPHFVIVKHRGFSPRCAEALSLFFSPFCSLSKAWRGWWGKTGSTTRSLSLIHCFLVIQPTPPCLCFPPISLCSSAVPPPRSPPFLISHHLSVYPHNLFCSVNLCNGLLYWALYLFLFSSFLHLRMLPDICSVCLLNNYGKYQAL